MTELKDHPLSGSGEANMPRYLGETVKSIASESYGWHSHGWGQLISAASGSMYVGTPDLVLLLSPAMVLWIPPDVEHWMRYGPDNEMRYVDVRRDEAGKIGADCRIIAMTPLLGALMSETVPRKGRGRADGHKAALHDLLRHELAAAPDVPLSITLPRDSRIRRFAESALDDPGVIDSVETWLADAPASRKTVERLFTAETGMPPSRWLRHARLFHAISRLSAGEKVSSVAFDMGYASSSAFSYMFRQSLGRSPSDFCS
ncbi:AraC family transcriptional regulator [Denitrobaculum tricleocarpae]|uniref:Helix-turn-helix transcriptional regulator n=1 Tax=Denitrobaculum tricleocarpae TaxID=2591009 RepID=A0A545TFW3_9PROT|nr:helix-turn-helix transcriptional regulator [Denitrobaculum tricleocarpae]TQV76095.1 helix-turn-helix transcriptional regulator [Denitrobaculum tricleocarpae]